jgi:hypothetical protein
MGNRNKTQLKDNKGLLPQEHATDAELVKLLGGTPLPADKKVIRINPKMINMVPPNMLQQVGAAHSHSAVHQHQPMIQTLAPSHSGLPVRAHLPHSAHHHSAPAAAFQKTRFRNPRMINSTHSSARKLSSETPNNSTAEVKLTKTQNSKDQTSDEAPVKKKDEGLKLQLPQDKTYLDTINDGKSDSDDSENDDRYVDLLFRVFKFRFSVVEDIKEAAAGDFLKYLLIKHCLTHEQSAHRKSKFIISSFYFKLAEL